MRLSGSGWWQSWRFSSPAGEKPVPLAACLAAVKRRGAKHASARHVTSAQTRRPALNLEPPEIKIRPLRVRGAWLRSTAAGIVLLGCSLPALASLGGTADSVQSDSVQMHAGVQVMQHDTYTIRAITLPGGGTVIDEYLSSAGLVFAVAWHGPFPPPMQQILGQYFQQYSAALQTYSASLQTKPRVYGHRPLDIEESGFVIQTGGHMRAHFGRVYLPDQLPQGVTANQIQ